MKKDSMSTGFMMENGLTIGQKEYNLLSMERKRWI